MSKASFLAFIITAVFAAQTTAQIYKTTDADGNVVFTDQPPAGTSSSEQVDLQQTNTAPAVTPRPASAPEPTEAEEPAPFEVSITSPANETTIPMGGGMFDVSAAVNPGIEQGQTLQLLMDGTPKGAPQAGSLWKLENVFRGAHDLSVQLFDSNGTVIATSAPVRVYVMRPGLN
ncbi:MAG: DUF4124 domain-containing protein [Halioglobus sp.]